MHITGESQAARVPHVALSTHTTTLIQPEEARCTLPTQPDVHAPLIMASTDGGEAPERGRQAGGLYTLLHSLANRQPGRLLLCDVARHQRERTESAGGGRPRGGGGGARQQAAQGGGPGPDDFAAALASAVEAIQDLGRMLEDPTFAKIPVPTVYMGKLMSPIPANR